MEKTENEISSELTSLTSQDDSHKEEGHREGHQIVNLAGNRVRSHSLSSSAPDHHMKFRKPATARRPQKSISYRTQRELELEEVKGFMDLGFIFKKENVSARMMNVVPGLQRLSMHHNNDDEELMDAPKAVEDGSVEKEGAERSITRPYLSEACLTKRPDSQLLNLKIPRRPDSQLLNLKIPRLCSTEDMKKRLRYWAKTVAFEITKNETFYSI